jgi:uncharacterized coiled-coil protein SlyX
LIALLQPGTDHSDPLARARTELAANRKERDNNQTTMMEKMEKLRATEDMGVLADEDDELVRKFRLQLYEKRVTTLEVTITVSDSRITEFDVLIEEYKTAEKRHNASVERLGDEADFQARVRDLTQPNPARLSPVRTSGMHED